MISCVLWAVGTGLLVGLALLLFFAVFLERMFRW